MEPAWDEYRRRCRVVWLALLLLPLWFALVSSVVYVLARFGIDFESALNSAYLLIGTLLLGNVMVAQWRRSFWPCPRCGKPFHRTWWYGDNWFTRRCLHCGLPKWPPKQKQKPAEIDFA